MNDTNKDQKANLQERLKVIGGLIAVATGVVAVTAIGIVAMALADADVATIAASTAGVIATIVGAYFGVKIGTDQAKTALESKDAQAAKAEVYALHAPEGKATHIRQEAEAAVVSLRAN
jgi:hypothetical protein